MILSLCILAYLAVGCVVARVVGGRFDEPSVALPQDDPALYGFVALVWPVIVAGFAAAGALWLLGRLAGVGVKR